MKLFPTVKYISKSIFISLFFCLHTNLAYSASFTINDGETISTQQTLNSNNETGTINSGGTLSVDSNDAIVISGDDINVTNEGTIAGTGVTADGISLTLGTDDVTINNSGSISGTDDGIKSNGDSNIIINSGSISGTRDGIDDSGDNTTIINNGTISATNGVAISSGGDAANITNNNSVNAANNTAIEIDGASSTLINNGTIQSANDVSIYSGGVGVNITNNGSIISSNIGIEIDALNNSVINNGSIITTGGDGISTDARNTSIINNGKITTSGNDNDGIYVNSSLLGVVVNNSGSITTSGTDSDGIATESSGDIVNSGTITVSGSGASGVLFDPVSSDVNNFTNSGIIYATGSTDKAITGTSGAQNIILAKGSKIIGKIDLGAGTDSIRISGNSGSARILVNNVENINIDSKVSGFVDNNIIHIVDPTSFSMINVGINNLNNNIHNSVNSHIGSLGQKQDDDKKRPIWMEIFGSNFERGEEENNLAYEQNNFGIIAGFDRKNNSGFLFGINSGNFETNESSFEGNVMSFFVGAYKYLQFSKTTDLKLNLNAGYERYSTDRHIIDNINGNQIAESSFNNFFISPSLNLEHKVKYSDNFEIQPNAQISYTGSLFDEQKEDGAQDANLTFKSRHSHSFNGRIGIKTIYKLSNYQFSFGGGFDKRLIIQDDITAKSSGGSFKLAAHDSGSVNGTFLNFGATILNLKNVRLKASFERRSADRDEKQNIGNLSLFYKF